MNSDIAFGAARVYAIPMRARFRGITIREGMLIEGPAGVGRVLPVRRLRRPRVRFLAGHHDRAVHRGLARAGA